jgi:hypothetical protein
LMHLMADPGNAFVAGKLAWAMTGGSSDLHHLLVQKHDGTFLLALWVEEPCYDVNSQTYLNVATENITLSFDSPVSIETINSWQLDGTLVSAGSGPAKQSSLSLAITDLITVITLHK